MGTYARDADHSDLNVTIEGVRRSKLAMSGSVLGGATWHLEMSWGTSPEIALPGHVPREALSGPPDVRCPGRPHTDECGRVQVRPCSTAIQALSSQAPGRIPWGESAPGHGKAPWYVGPWGDRRPGRLFHMRAENARRRAVPREAQGAPAAQHAKRGAGNCATSHSRPAAAHTPSATNSQALTRTTPAPAGVTAPRPARSPARQHPCRSAADARSGTPAP